MISILQTAFLGDTLLTIPLVKALKLEGHRVQLICREGLGSFLEQLALFDSIIEIKKGNSNSYQAALGLLHPKSELISPHESPRSKLFALKAKRRGIRTIGYSLGGLRSPLAVFSYSDSVARPMELPEALRQLALLQVAGVSNSKIWTERLEGFRNLQKKPGGRDHLGHLIPVPEWASMELPILMDRKQRSAGTHSSAVLAPGSVWPTKRWTAEGFSSVGASLVKNGYTLKLVGTKEESEVCESVAKEIRKSLSNDSAAGSQIEVLAGKVSLWQTAEAIADAALAVTNDSGAMHLAAVAGTPTIAIFGPTILDFGYRPWSNRARVIEPSVDLKCRPCGKHGAKTCPIGTHECMTGIDASRILRELKVGF